MAAHRYWRLTCTVIPSGGAVQFAEIELRSSLGGSDLTGSGTASAQTSAGGHAPSAAVDNDNTTWWQTTTFVPTWWKYDFGSGNAYDVVEIAITPHAGNYTSAPADFLIEYSDDDSTYTTAREVRMTWSSDAQRVIPVIVGVEFAPHNMTSNSLPTPYVAAASSEFSGSFAAHAVFNSTYAFTGSYWVSSGGPPQWVSIDLGSGNALSLGSYSIRVNTVPEPNRAPKDFKLQGSNNNSTWTDLDTRTGETSWQSGEIRDYDLGSASAAYRYYRLNVSANNGDSLVGVAELYLRQPTVTSQILSPSSIGPDEAFGSATVIRAQFLLPSGIASAEAFGSAIVSGRLLVVTGITSGEAFGTAIIVRQGLLLPSGIGSSETLGSPYIEATVGPSAIGSGEVFGNPVIQQPFAITVFPNAIGSAEAFGIPVVLGGLQFILPLGINTSAWGFPILIGGSDAPFLYINSVNILVDTLPSGAEVRSARISKQIGGFGQADFTYIDRDGTHMPAIGQDIRIGEYGRIEFSGVIQSFTDEVIMSTGVHKYAVKCVGFSDLASRRIYSTIYPAGSDGYKIIADIVENGLSGEGVTAYHVDTPWSVNEDPGLTFLFKKVNEILDSIRDYSSPSDYWFIDDFRDLHFHSALSACATGGVFITPFSLVTGNKKYRLVKVSYNGKEYRNVQYVRSNRNFNFAARTETVTITPAMIPISGSFVLTKFPITSPPAVTINGSPIVVLEVGVDPGATAGWFYLRGGVGISNLSVTLSVGDIVVFEYNSFATNMVKVENADAIAVRKLLEPLSSGRIENIFEVKDMDEIQAAQVAQGLLDQFSVLQCAITYETDCPDVVLGLVQHVDLTENGLTGDFVITQIDSTMMENDLGFKSSYRRQVTLSNTDSSGTPFKFLGHLIVRTNQGAVDTQHEKATLTVTDGPIQERTHAGPPYQVKRNGIITGVSGSITVPPSGDLIRIDVLLNNVSIFMPGRLLDIGIGVASDDIIANAVIDQRNIVVREGDIITFDILNTDDGTARDLSVVVTMETPK